jgi:MoaA/NifB/PqqE/SkfB family radical SAM enzyme
MKQFFNLNQKLNLAKSILFKSSPLYVQFYITARCNLVCEQCNIIHAESSQREMDINQINKVAENLAEIGLGIVLLIGGEPFVRKDIAEIVKAFTNVGIHVRMQTNGIATRDQLEKCVKNGGHDISVSLDSLDEKIQDEINGNFKKSWTKAINTISLINEIFPENGTAFFNNVFMPKSINQVEKVIKFGTKIGWGTSIVPCHITDTKNPRGFSTFDYEKNVTFNKNELPQVKKKIENIKKLRDSGETVYDSDEYLDDMYRYLAGEKLEWRSRNNNICDSPNLYFAISPNGNLKTCCDFETINKFPVYDEDFPKFYKNGTIEREVYNTTSNCSGCLYGSYPEITITARYLKPMIKRMLYFNYKPPKLKKYNFNELLEIAEFINQS